MADSHIFLASLPILPRHFYTRSRPFVRIWTHRRLPSFMFAKNMTVLQSIFPQTNKIKYKHADYLYIYHWKTTSNESNAGHICSFMRLPNVLSQLCTFSCGQQKNCLLVLCSKWSFLSCSVKTGRHVARTRPHPGSSWTVHRRNMATKLSTDGSRETLWQIIIRGKSVLYFKRSGKVKNKLPVGGRLWILFESIWQKSYHLNNYRGLKYLIACWPPVMKMWSPAQNF